MTAIQTYSAEKDVDVSVVMQEISEIDELAAKFVSGGPDLVNVPDPQ